MSNFREMMISAGDNVKNITIDYKIGKSKYSIVENYMWICEYSHIWS